MHMQSDVRDAGKDETDLALLDSTQEPLLTPLQNLLIQRPRLFIQRDRTPEILDWRQLDQLVSFFIRTVLGPPKEDLSDQSLK